MKNIENIWLVDDDEIFQFITKTYFEFEVPKKSISTFNSGKDAMDRLQGNGELKVPDIILLDINMPLMNGWEFLDEYIKIKSKFRKRPKIFMITSSDNEMDKSKANKYEDVEDFIEKPVDDIKVKKIIAQATE